MLNYIAKIGSEGPAQPYQPCLSLYSMLLGRDLNITDSNTCQRKLILELYHPFY